MYGVRIEDMPRIAEAGFDVVHSYRWDGAGTNEEAIEYLDAAHALELSAFIGFHRRRLMDGDEEFVARRVGALMEHPALFGWYLYDEPDLPSQYVSPMWLSRYYRLIRTLDPFHPVIVTCAHDDSPSAYREAYDVHWTQVYNGTPYVASRLDRHRSALGDDVPLLGILPCFDRVQTAAIRERNPTDPRAFTPDGRRMRADAFMAVAHNSSGLAWWWWGQGSDRYFTVRHAPEAWAGLKETLSRLRTLRPLLTAPSRPETSIYTGPGGDEIHLWSKTIGEELTIIAVNPKDQDVDFMFRLRKDVPADLAGVRFENRDVEIRDGVLSDTFEPFDVHVYTIDLQP
jgi:hypothetical protein